jgi:hypothetical protein
MKLMNRGYIAVNPKREFMQKTNEALGHKVPVPHQPEASIYLIEEDFIDDHVTLNEHIKKIIISELKQLDPEGKKPRPEINANNFHDYFEVSMGSFVFDLHDQALHGIKDD